MIATLSCVVSGQANLMPLYDHRMELVAQISIDIAAVRERSWEERAWIKACVRITQYILRNRCQSFLSIYLAGSSLHRSQILSPLGFKIGAWLSLHSGLKDPKTGTV